MSFDPRITSLVPFMPHPFPVLARALPPGTLDAAMYDNVKRKYARLTDQVIERITYNVQGHRVTGAVARPASITPGTHPILIFNRGGSGDYGMLVLPVILRYMLPFAEAGHLVFASNYRGNDGGNGQEQFGGDDLNDILELIDIARQHPGWDSKNIFMFGGSRGGMMTYLAIKAGAALNAAATFGGISDLFASDGNWPALVERFYARVPEPKPSLEIAMEARSAVRWPEALARVPLLIAHGDADKTVTADHTEKLAALLEAQHAPVKKIIFPGGNHSLSTHMLPLIQEVSDWFARHRA